MSLIDQRAAQAYIQVGESLRRDAAITRRASLLSGTTRSAAPTLIRRASAVKGAE